MAREYLELSCVPADEECQQVGTPNYDSSRAYKECQAFHAQLLRQFGPEPFGAHLGIKSFPHDFGSYYEVVCYYDDRHEESIEYAFNIENNLPTEWDSEALHYLGLATR